MVIEINSSSPDVFFMTEAAIVLKKKNEERRCEKVRAMNIARFVDNGLVMNTISPWFPRIALDSFRCVFFFLESRLSDYLCKCCTVWFRNTHTLHFGIRSYIVQMRWCAYELCSAF